MRWSNFYVLPLSILLVGCQSGSLDSDDSDSLSRAQRRDREVGKLFGDDTFSFGGDNKSSNNEAAGITVNEYLWRASLDTVSFMPLRTADPFGGVILTEWYTPEGSKNERLKVDIFILSRQLKSTGIRVAMHKQVYKAQTQQWVDTPVDKKTLREFEDVILTRARQLKVEHKI